jgi:threonine/homoserine/homoserine lactone efflux protein
VNELSALGAVLAALGVGVVSPGPSFVMVARTAVSSSRSHGLAAALGMGAGGVLFALIAVLGLQAILIAVPSLYVGLKIVGGAYLAYLGFRIWRAAPRPLAMDDAGAGRDTSWRTSFALGFVTQASNPKTAIVYASVFAAFLPPAPSLAFDVALVLIVFALESGWYAVVALALSAEAPRRAYLRFKTAVDRVAGGVMMLLGLKLILSSQRA